MEVGPIRLPCAINVRVTQFLDGSMVNYSQSIEPTKIVDSQIQK